MLRKIPKERNVICTPAEASNDKHVRVSEWHLGQCHGYVVSLAAPTHNYTSFSVMPAILPAVRRCHSLPTGTPPRHVSLSSILGTAISTRMLLSLPTRMHQAY
jgi:hypothetical protein